MLMIPLEGVHEYNEYYDVKLVKDVLEYPEFDARDPILTDVVVAWNEAHCNCVYIDAKELYRELHKVYGEKND